MQPPHLVHLIDELKLGGAQTHLLTMIREARRAYQTRHTIVSLFGDGTLSAELRALGCQVVVLDLREPIRSRRYLSAYRGVKSELKQLKPDLVEAHLTWSRLLGLPAARSLGVPKRYGFEQGDVYFNALQWRIANFLGQFCADKIIVCSSALAKWVNRTHGTSKRRLEIFHNCVSPDWETLYGQSTVNRSDLGVSADSTLFCSVGTLGSGVNKRTDISIRALAMARETGADVEMVVCGDGDQRGSLEKLAKDLNLSGHIRFLGMRKDVPAIMASCDAFCHAAPFEPFGIVCLEAMLSGLPVVIPDTGGMIEILNGGNFGLSYRSLDPADLARRMIELHQAPEKRRKMGAAGRQAVRERFLIEAYMSRLYDLYELTHTKRGTPAA